MKRILRPLAALAFLLALPLSFSSCQEDAPEVDYKMEVTVTNDFSKVVEAINQGALKKEEAIKKLTEALDKMQADQATKLKAISDILGDVNKTLETKLAAIEGAISSQTLSLEGKLDILAEAIGKHLLKQEELTGKITEAIDKLGGTLDQKLKEITDAINSTAKTTQDKLDRLMGLINTQTIPLSDKLDAIAKAIRGLTESSAQQLEALNTTLSALLEQAKAKGATEASVLKQLEALVTKAAELQEEVKQGKSSAALAVAAILKQLEEIKAKIGSTPTPPAEAVEYVDLGLPSGLKWATCNLGATKPEESGTYYAWGETEPKERYVWSTYKHAKAVTKADGSTDYPLTKYCSDAEMGLDGFTDGKTRLEPADDAATVKLGAPWRMPTEAEIEELVAGCTWTKETINGTPCLRATSKANGKSIVICTAGLMDDTSHDAQHITAAFWASTLYSASSARGTAFLELGNETFEPATGNGPRKLGLPIRAVHP
nr:hypothetical protein [uncultured Porphyromonas sp.]